MDTAKKRKIITNMVLAILVTCLLVFFWPRKLEHWIGGQDIIGVHAVAQETTFSVGGISTARWSLDSEEAQVLQNLEKMASSCRYRMQLRTILQPDSYECRSAKTATLAVTLSDGSVLWIDYYGDFAVISPDNSEVRVFAVPGDRQLTEKLADYLMDMGEKA